MPQRTRFLTADQTLVRKMNLSLIMNRLHQSAPLSRQSLAEMTGLNKSTISSLVNELISLGLIRENSAVISGVGRPSVPLELHPQAGVLIGAKIGVGWLTVMCTNFTADELWSHIEEFALDSEPSQVIARLIELLRQGMSVARSATGRQRPLGVSIAVTGLVDHRDGVLQYAPNLHWQQVNLRSAVAAAFPGVPIFVDNEAKLAALGEYFFGAAHGGQDVLYLSVGYGINGAILHNGEIVRGADGFAGEFGHMTMYAHGELCNCGNRGCWETRASLRALYQYIQDAIQRGQKSLLKGRETRLTPPPVSDAAHKGDKVALAALAAVGRELGAGCASLINIFNPDLIVLGGVTGVANDLLIPHINQELHKHVLSWSARKTRIVPARHTTHASTMGGVAAVFQAVLTDPTSAQTA